MFTRDDRDKLIDDTKLALDECVKLGVDELVDNGWTEETEGFDVLCKCIRLMYRTIDFCRFKAKRIDHIEDQLDSLTKMIEKQNKEAMSNC